MQLEPFQKSEPTISSLEIAAMVGSRHDKVKQSIERLVNGGVIPQPPMGDGPKAANGVTTQLYLIGKRSSYIIVAQLSPEFTAKLVDRWQELEAQLAAQQFQLPTTMAEALRLAADSIERAEVAERQLVEVAPKVQTYNEIMSSDAVFNFREVAGQLPSLNFGSNTLISKLIEAKVLYRDSDGNIRSYQQFTSKGYFKLIERPYEVKETGGTGTGEFRVSATLKVTPAGVEFISRKLAAQ